MSGHTFKTMMGNLKEKLVAFKSKRNMPEPMPSDIPMFKAVINQSVATTASSAPPKKPWNEFFRAALLRRLASYARTLTGDNRVTVVEGDIACIDLDKSRIYLNTTHTFLLKMTEIWKRILALRGTTAHESFHYLFSDGSVIRDANTKGGKLLVTILNIIEDAAIEAGGAALYPGTLRELRFNNRQAFRARPDLDGMDTWQALVDAMACWTIIGRIKGHFPDDKSRELFEQVRPLLEDGRIQPTPRKRYEFAVRVWEILDKEIPQTHSSRQTQITQTSLGKGKGGQGQKITGIVEVREFGPGGGQGTQQGQQGQQGSSASNNNSPRRKSGENNPAPQPPQGSDPNGAPGGKGESDDYFPGCEGSDPEEEQNSPANGGNSPSDDESSKNGSSPEESPEKDDEDLKQAQQEIETEMEGLESDAESEEQAAERARKQRESMEKIQYGNIHKGIRVSNQYPGEGFNMNHRVENEYDLIYEEVKDLINSMVNAINQMRFYNQEEKMTKLTSGRLNTHRLYDRDGRLFYQKRLPNQESDLVIAFLIDESGSMHGVPIQQAKKAAILLERVCTKAKIPVAIIGENAVSSSPVVEHRVYIPFRGKRIPQALTQISARDNTREGVSLQFVGEYLLQQPQKDKILIIAADGDPYHGAGGHSLSGIPAQKNARDVVKKLERQGVHTIALELTDETNLRTIYDNVIAVHNLSLLPKKLVGVIKKKILKEDSLED